MKKFIIVAAALVSIFLLLPKLEQSDASETFLRVHIRADSNSSADQAVKYKVKDAVVEYLIPHLAECATFDAAMEKIASLLNNIETEADKILADNNFSYRAKARLTREEFPARTYDGFTLESGVYDALIINLGSGSGDNWWCVVYPPLCFVNASNNGTNQIKYKSKLMEIIENFKK